jgi:hypothetical protein
MNKPTDECITNERIQIIHNRMAHEGPDRAINDLAERESQMAAYVLYSAHIISDAAHTAGAKQPFVDWVSRAVSTSMLVALEAQHQAHYELWRDLMGDQPDSTTMKGENNAG